MNLQNENCSTFYKDPGFKIPKVVTANGKMPYVKQRTLEVQHIPKIYTTEDLNQ